MPISILSPQPAPAVKDYDSPDDGSIDSEGDYEMGEIPRPKRIKLSRHGIVTPGESITEDPQWMR